jgi:CDP-4-dehydro-6-deoxyglucose reductase, E1
MTDSELAELRTKILELSGRYAELAHGAQPFVAGTSAVPPSGKVLGAQEMRFLVDSCLDFWLTTGRFNTRFESALAKATGTRRTLTTNSGSSANLLAATALTSHVLGDKALKPGDEVITCATGFPTTVNPLIQNGLIPVFLDVELGTYNIDVTHLEAALSLRTRAIMIAHALGNPFNLDVVAEFARKHDLFLIEDCCDALGATYRDRKVGTFGAMGTLSFYPAHHITMGEGGALQLHYLHAHRGVDPGLGQGLLLRSRQRQYMQATVRVEARRTAVRI